MFIICRRFFLSDVQTRIG